MTHRTPLRSALATLAAIPWWLFATASLAAHPPEEPQAPSIPWQRGSGAAPIGQNLAEIDLDESYAYLDGEGTRAFMERLQNPVSGNELATVTPVSEDANWFVVFEFDPIGYVKDDEKDSLDADAMIASIREGTKEANEERRKRGWPALEIVGWHEPPHYDAQTQNLSWAVVTESDNGKGVNRIIKLLGRRGVMTVTLVASVDGLPAAVPVVDSLLAGYRFKPGSTYAEFVPSTDKLAEYGLTALVVGGAGAALVKSGLLAKLWKPLVIGIMAFGAGVKRFFTGGRKVERKLEGPIA